jgi:hypothetical protein
VSSVPFTRTLSYVLREKLDRTGVTALIGKVASVPDGKRVTIDQAGVLTTIPRISTYVPTVGEPAICLAADTMIVAVGAVGGAVPTGPQGPTGPAGPAGPTGPAGPAGPATFISGSGNPASGTGVDGAFYLDTSTLRLWGPKASGAWPGAPVARLMPLTPTYAQLKSG